jgi:hypothetical protein
VALTRLAAIATTTNPTAMDTADKMKADLPSGSPRRRPALANTIAAIPGIKGMTVAIAAKVSAAAV